MISLRGYAEKNGVSYEAIRKQVARYKEELGDHIIIDGRQQFLDDEAVAFLDERRKKNPVVVFEKGWAEQVEQLKLEKEELLTELKEVYKRLATLEGAQARLEAANKQTMLLENAYDQASKALEEMRESAFQRMQEADLAAERELKAAQEAEEAHQRVKALEEEKRALEAENEALRGRSWWEVLRKKRL